MDYQSTLETVVRHLFAQGRKAGDSKNCYYRAPDGTKCAVGILIPDDQYDPRMDRDNETISMIAVKFSEKPFFKSIREHMSFLTDLQNIHDNDAHWISTSAMKNAVKWYFGRTFGFRNKLDLSFMDDLSFPDR